MNLLSASFFRLFSPLLLTLSQEPQKASLQQETKEQSEIPSFLTLHISVDHAGGIGSTRRQKTKK
jgi:hypothetical protein